METPGGHHNGKISIVKICVLDRVWTTAASTVSMLVCIAKKGVYVNV